MAIGPITEIFWLEVSTIPKFFWEILARAFRRAPTFFREISKNQFFKNGQNMTPDLENWNLEKWGVRARPKFFLRGQVFEYLIFHGFGFGLFLV